MIFFFFFFFFINSLCFNSMVVSIIFMSAFIFSFFWSLTGVSWMFSIFSLLFMGGILIIFMTISSLYPNVKIRESFVGLFMMVFYYYSFFFFLDIKILYILDFKWCFFSGFNFFCFLFLITTFFFCFIYMVSKDKISLRSFL